MESLFRFQRVIAVPDYSLMWFLMAVLKMTPTGVILDPVWNRIRFVFVLGCPRGKVRRFVLGNSSSRVA